MTFAHALNSVAIPILALLGIVMWQSSGLGRMGIKSLWHGVRCCVSAEKSSDGLSGYETLVTSLAATIGTANIAGASAALLIGGPGALVWMWICGLLGMAIKYAEAVLAVKYSRMGADGRRFGGPMYCMQAALGNRGRPLAAFYCAAGVLSAVATGAFWQMAAASETVGETAKLFSSAQLDETGLRLICGLVGASLSAPVVFGGGRAAVKAATTVVPIMCLGYVAATVTIICVNAAKLPEVLLCVLRGVLDPAAATGGILGSGIAAAFTAASSGIQTGIFSSEAGLGSAAISYAASGEGDPARAGFCGMVEVFVDTMLLCSLTVLAIMCGTDPDYGSSAGVAAVICAFSSTFGPVFSGVFLTASICMFALSSVFTWSWYGASCLRYLTKSETASRVYCFAFVLLCALGGMFTTGEFNWLVALSNLLLVIPNAVLLLKLRGETSIAPPVDPMTISTDSYRETGT